MAMGVCFVCSNCARSIEAWDDGNPYYLDEGGKKVYAYHPDHKALAKCIGNDAPNLCLACGAEFMVDSNAPVDRCVQCGATCIVDCWELEGEPCPFCHAGKLVPDPSLNAIS